MRNAQKKSTRRASARVLPAVALLLAPLAAHAVGPVEFTGYFRSGVGANSEAGDQVCFALPGAKSKYRLGNECETYGELAFGLEVMKTQSGASFHLQTMAAFVVPNQTDWEQFEPSWRQVFVEARNIGTGALSKAKLWAGKRYYDRQDVHITDFFYWSNSGPGAGIQDVDFGFGKFSYALRRNGEETTNATAGERQLIGHDFRLKEIAVNPNGTLDFGFDFRHRNSRDDIDNTKAAAFTVMHTQAKIFNGGQNRVALQFGKGALSNLDFTGPAFAAASGDKTWRVVDALVWQPSATSNLSGQATVVFENRDIAGTSGNGDSLSGKWFSIGARPVYHFTDHWSAALEAGVDQFKPDSGQTRRLTKVTLAGQYGPKRDFWARPVLRAFVTHARWNDAAQAAANAGDPLSATGVFGTKTRGTTYGVQAEVWW